ncbi:MAG: hypothetical protein HQK89_08675 [Nitrospirae bacterium]|nr:hypothetical protein [Nitrospirota bacterium]
MMKVNTVLFMSLVEALVVFFALTIFFYFRSRRAGKSKQGLQPDTEELIAQLEAEAEKLSMSQPTNEEESKVQATRLNFVVSMLETLKKGGKSSTSLWDEVYGSIDNMVSESVASDIANGKNQNVGGKAGAQDVSSSAQQQASSVSGQSVAIQKKQLLELLRYKDMFTELDKEFGKLKIFNEELMEAIEEPAVNSEALQQVIMELEKKNKHIDKLSNGLKKEGDHVNERIDEVGSMTTAGGGGGTGSGGTRFEAQGGGDSGGNEKMARRVKELEKREAALLKKVADLEKSVKEKDKTSEKLQKDYKDLEEEFVKLHKSHPGETGWSNME